MAERDFTVEHLMSRLSYDCETGAVTWLTHRRPSRVGGIAGGIDVNGYLQLNFEKSVLKVHRIAWALHQGEWPNGHIDHINGVRTDNRICNLRVVTNAVNCQNKRLPLPANKSGFLGVSWNRGAWRASIQVDGKSYHIGRFSSPEEAHDAYVRRKREVHEGCAI